MSFKTVLKNNAPYFAIGLTLMAIVFVSTVVSLQQRNGTLHLNKVVAEVCQDDECRTLAGESHAECWKSSRKDPIQYQGCMRAALRDLVVRSKERSE